MKLAHLLEGLAHYHLDGDPELEIEGLAYDSRQAGPGYLFVALRGHELNGHDYLADAICNGAVAVVGEEFAGLPKHIARVRVPDSREALSRLASRFYDDPFKGMNIIGITGTNGKTTTSFLLESILHAAGARPGVIGTINYRFLGQTYPAPITTPESLDLMHLLRRMAEARVTDVILEVSSHALHQKRTGECPFKVAIFTNLSRDHLDYHQTMEAYFRAKSLLFQGLRGDKAGGGATAVINRDDPKGPELAAMTEAALLSYGLGPECDVRAEGIVADRVGLKARLITPVGSKEIRSSLLGEINIYNILAAATGAIALRTSLDAVVEGVGRLKGIPGRLERVRNRRGLTLVVDYAHTPDALLKALKTLRPLVKGRLITVFGCGGDRDKGKRPEMGRVAGQQSDLVFITSDNPRKEDPHSIIRQIEKGIRESPLPRVNHFPRSGYRGKGYFVEVDRREAIRQAVAIAGEEDLVLIAGKGHEDYQIVGAERRTFDDRAEAAKAADALGHQ